MPSYDSEEQNRFKIKKMFFAIKFPYWPNDYNGISQYRFKRENGRGTIWPVTLFTSTDWRPQYKNGMVQNPKIHSGPCETKQSFRGVNAGSAWFAQLGYQQAALTQDEYRPGSQTSFTAGYNQPLVGALTGTLQLNALLKNRDSGANAEWVLSGGRYVFISPGLNYAVSNSIQIYAYAQLPIYRYVNGVQLVADYGFVGGAAIQF